MRSILQVLSASEKAKKIKEELAKPSAIQISGCIDGQKTQLIHLFGSGPRSIVISYREQKARELMMDADFYGRDSLYYPAKDFLFYRSDVRGGELDRERSLVYQSIEEKKSLTVYTTIDAFLDGLRERSRIRSEVLELENGQEQDPEELKEKLAQMGYERVYQVEHAGEFAVRGGIVDIYPLSEDYAYRLEFFDVEIDSIRLFEPGTQRSIENLEKIRIYPLETEAEDREGSASFFSYFDPKETVIFLDDPDRCFGRIREIEEEIEESRMHRQEKGEKSPETICFREEAVREEMKKFPLLAFSDLDQPAEGFAASQILEFPAKSTNHYHNSFDQLIRDLQSYKKKDYKVLLASSSRTRARRLAGEFLEQGLNSFYTEDPNHEIKRGEVMITPGRVAEGTDYPWLKFALITDGDIFAQQQKKRRRKKAEEGEKINSFTELNPGDYVIHENHGIGIYRGIEKMTVADMTKDYIKIEYAKGGLLYVQINQLDLIQKYGGSDGAKPKLNSLGGKEWQKTKSKVRSSVDEVAQELVDLYALRQEQEGFVYGEDTVWQREFEEMFPYEETEDQLNAIRAVKADMQSKKIMDRLICGDVGFGKTEVAIRAAFKAIQEGKQVVYLVPTTILAQQHFKTFSERMKNFPVRVDMLCRFNSAKEQKKTIADLKKGLVDVVIGTHRLLSKEIQYKDLGLLIIDEEQRFGVAHKEKIKQMKTNIDVLSLTATPIPRTLHMSLIGIRDMSLLEEAPMDRLPIQTFVMEYDEETIREAIQREMKRGGQVYYVYNRVNDIADVARRIGNLLPQARVSYAHGQMNERELEDVMIAFVNGEIDVLVSTTIVETGLDISNVNTMIIHDADRFGLSQLYQLRGRVGRSNRLAYAFLMYKKKGMLKETAEKRLAAIREFTDLGSGIRIAMRDLEIRGAGNLLGQSQSGNMEAVGYELYCKMLNEAIRRLKGEAVEEAFETVLDLKMDAYIPESYVRDELQKMDIYKRIAAIASREDREEMEDELIDRFGDLPKSLRLLLTAAELKAAAHSLYLTEIKEKGGRIELTLYERARIHTERIPELMQLYPQRLSFHVQPLPGFTFSLDKKKKQEEQLEELKKLLTDMRKMLLEEEKA